MKKYMIITILSLIIFNCQFSIVNCQNWKELMDSCNVYQQVQDYQTALKWAEKALPQAEKEFGKLDSTYVSTLGAISEIYNYSGNLDSAIHFGNTRLILSRKIFKGDHPDLANSIMWMAYFYDVRGAYKEAEPLFKEALEMARRIFMGDHPSLAFYISNMAHIYKAIGNYKEAEPLYKEALEMRRRLLKGDHPDLANSIHKMANFYNAIGNYKEAEPLFKEALEMSRRLFKGDHTNLARSINSLAGFYESWGNYKEAETLCKEALEMRRRLFRGDHPDLANSIEWLSSLYNLRGNYKEAEPLYKEALEMRRRLFKGDHPDLASSINYMAGFYKNRGNYKEAEPLFKEALEMYRRIFKSDHPELAASILNMAAFYKEVGNYKEAEPLYKEALEMYRRIFKGDHPDLANSINYMAVFYESRGNYKEAEPLFKEALEMYRRIFKGDYHYFAASILCMAGFYESRGNYKEAEPLFKEALEMYRRIFKGDAPDLANSINNMACFYNKMGNYKEAEPLFKEALEMYRRIFKGDHPLLALTINNMAMFYDIRGNYNEAEPLFIEGLQVYMNILNNYFPSLSEKEKGQFWSTMKENFELFNTFAVKRADNKQEILCNIYENQLNTKAMLLNSTLKIKNRILNSGDSILIDKYEDWQFQKNNIAKLQTQPKVDLAKKGINLDSLIQEVNDREKELSRLSEDFAKEYNKKTVSWKDVQSSLEKNESAIEIVRFRYYDKKFTDTIFYAALIIKTDSKLPELVLLENGNGLEGKYIELYRNQINQQRKQVYDPEKIESNLTELYKQFCAPIQEKLKGIKTAYLSPDGVYNQINLNTLINPMTGKYLLEEIDLRIVTSTRDLITKNTANDQRPTDHEKTAVLFGDPQFNLDSPIYAEIASRYVGDRSREYYYMGNNLDTLSRQGISSLPGTRKEIDKISSDMKAKKWDVKTFLGSDAIEEAIKAVKSPRVLHIATHGKFMKDVEIKEERSFGMETQRYVENPLLRSMLLFAGAENTIFRTSNPALSQTEDGLLTAYEAMNLNLDNTELVVLSACETGLGEIKNGEGVYGLQRAFQVAGAKSLIMSLWSVSDAATQELMTSFYDKWLTGKTKREAFREAQQELKKKYPGFYYWGAFVMVGE